MNQKKMRRMGVIIALFVLPVLFSSTISCSISGEKREGRDARMAWWSEARFGMFIHWGLYAIPAGEWNGETNHAEWIRTTAKIPIKEYEKFVDQFNPVKFNAEVWVKLAKDAGMKYIVITSKHHDGFCLFDSKYTDFDIMSTPFKRDIMKELSKACQRHGIKMCWYHSIMDWHHPDYLPRRGWETNRSAEGADFSRFVEYLRGQVTELLTNYGEIGVMWFDGQWEDTWTHEYGQPLYDLCRNLQPNVIVNDRVDKGRQGHSGIVRGEYAGDFGTPEQHIPATGLPGVDWETCMTMNNHWGYNKHDHNWKSNEDLLHKLADIASKGGNFLLNVGPTAQGLIPQSSIDRLRAMGKWMKVNSESIYGTQASPFKQLKWGRCTQKPIKAGTRLYLHVFDWPSDGKLVVPGIFNQVKKAYLLSDPKKVSLDVSRKEDELVISVPIEAPDPINSVVVLHINGRPDINDPPEINAEFVIFVDDVNISVTSDRENIEIRYTLEGSLPNLDSELVTGPIRLTETTTLSARCFRDGKAVSGSMQSTFTKVKPKLAVNVSGVSPGLQYSYFEGDWDRLPDFNALNAAKSGVLSNFNLTPRNQEDYFGFQFSGYIKVPKDGAYVFYTDSDDGSRLYIGNELIVDNDGLHGMQEKEGIIALSAGLHPIRVTFFEKTGGDGLKVLYKGPGIEKQSVPDNVLFYTN